MSHGLPYYGRDPIGSDCSIWRKGSDDSDSRLGYALATNCEEDGGHLRRETMRCGGVIRIVKSTGNSSGGVEGL